MRCPYTHPATLTLLQLWLLWGQVVRGAGGAFQMPHFLKTLSGQTESNGEGAEVDRMFTLPPAVLNVPNVRRFTPRKKHLKAHKLMKRMRGDWDPFWMSVERPEKADEDLVWASSDSSQVRSLYHLNLTLRGPDGVPRLMKVAEKKVVWKWLQQHISCHVRYTWQDLGLLYWPRWLRHGSCQAGDSSSSASSSFSSAAFMDTTPSLSTSCSWPPGMHCVPAQSRRLRILRWQCRHNKAFKNWRPWLRKGKKGKGKKGWRRVKRAVQSDQANNQTVEEEESNDTENWSRKPFKNRRRKLSMRCKWKKIPYPVTDDCFCSC